MAHSRPGDPAIVLSAQQDRLCAKRCRAAHISPAICFAIQLAVAHRRWGLSPYRSIFSTLPSSRPRLRFSTPVIPFLINIAEPLDSPKSFFIISRHCRGCKGQRHLREASLLRPVGMDSLQTAFSFCSCDGLALSWLQMRFLPS